MTEEKEQRFIVDYLQSYRHALLEPDLFAKLCSLCDLCLRVRTTGKKLIFVGNGASASISSHVATFFTQYAGVRSISFNDHNLITAFANDYSYEKWVSRALEAYADPEDTIVLISSSGNSPNMLNAASYAQEHNLHVVSFSGFSSDTPLRKMGELSFWVDSDTYNIVESVHLVWILAVANMIEGQGDDTAFLKRHFREFKRNLFEVDYLSKLVRFSIFCRDVSKRGGKLIFVGNGGSASIASHAANDYTKKCGIRSICFNDYNLISAFSNDYGQKCSISKCIEVYADPKDAVVLICSSGRSINIINAALVARELGLPVATFTGFDTTNRLKEIGDVNIWVDSCNNYLVDGLHSSLLLCVSDMLAWKLEL
jgi:D-sedoheptulose 7-phosphate isomerase